MFKRVLAVAAVGAAVLAIPLTTVAHAAPPTYARVIGTVHIDKSDPTVATFRAIYRCYGEGELWVSVKQDGARDRDPQLLEEGSSEFAITTGGAWSMSHRNPVTCDGKLHAQTFTVDQVETASFGIPLMPLARGGAYVQFCLFDDNYPAVGDDPATLMPYSDMRFNNVS